MPINFDQTYAGVSMLYATLAGWFGDDRGDSDSAGKLIWIAVSIAVAVAATAFVITIFNKAKTGVPDPVAPSP